MSQKYTCCFFVDVAWVRVWKRDLRGGRGRRGFVADCALTVQVDPRYDAVRPVFAKGEEQNGLLVVGNFENPSATKCGAIAGAVARWHGAFLDL